MTGAFRLFLIPLLSAGLYAQAAVGAGAVTGTVRDAVGQGIPDTTVVVSNEALGIQRSMFTTDDGVFDADALPPGMGYNLKATRNGFTTWEMKDFELHVGETLNFKIALQSETAAKTTEPGPALAGVEDTKHGVSDLITRPQVDSLPTNNRRLDALVPLAPAVNRNPATGVLAFRGEPFTNSILIDGIYTTNTHFFNQPDVAPQLPQDSIGEMQVISAGAPADFAHSMGGFVNVATQTQTGTLHGSAYEYYNNGSLNAESRYAPGFRPSGHQHQAGITAGDALAGNRFFWFTNLEVVDGKSQALNRITNPLLGNPSGTAVLASNCTATAAQCLAATNFLNSQFNVVAPRSIFSPSGLAKLDYRLTPGNSINFEASGLHRRAPNGAEGQTVANNGGLLAYNGTVHEDTRYARLGWTSSFLANAVNQVRVGWSRDRISIYADPKTFPSTGAVSITIAGTPIGANPAYPLAVSEQHQQIVDDFNFTFRSHSIRMGVDYSRNEDWTEQVANRFGSYQYSSLTTFAQDFSGNTAGRKDYSTYTQSFGNPVIDLHIPKIVAYVQDSWKVLSRLTLTGGVYYEKTSLPQPKGANPGFFQTGGIPTPGKNFAPRLGLAYLVNNRTVVRLGFGSYFQPFIGQLLDALYTGNSIYQTTVAINPTQTAAGAPVFPRTVAIPGSTPTGAQNIVYAIGKFRNPYGEQANLGIERSLGGHTSLGVSAIYSRGVRLWTASDQNLPAPTVNRTYIIDDASGAAVGTFNTPVSTARTNTSYAHVYEVANGGGSWYSGLAVQLRQRLSHGVGVQVSYTWSHAIDDVSGAPIPQLGFIPSNTYLGNYRNDQGDSLFDQRHRVVANWTWEPRLARSNSPISRYVVNGWQLSGIATLASSLKQTPIVVVNGQQFSGLTMAYTTSLNGSGGWARVPFESVSTLPTGHQYNVDARLARAVPITERVKATLMLEAFNAFNHQYNTSVHTVAYIATSGVLRPVPFVGVGDAADGFPYGTNARRAQVALRITF